MRKQVRAGGRMGAKPIILIALLFTTGVANRNQVVPAPRAQGTNLTVSYQLDTNPRKKLSLCTGEVEVIFVTLYRSMVPRGYAGPEPLEEIADAEIQGYVSDSVPRAGHFQENIVKTKSILFDGIAEHPRATFVFVAANKPAKGKINFLVNSTGDPSEWGTASNNGIQLEVEVADCYEAFASGLNTGNVANEFTKKNICSLEKPFSLRFTGVSQSSGATMNLGALRSYFAPINPPLQGVDGVYISIQDVVIQTPEATISCKLIGTGPYEIIWHNDNQTQGDIKLEGVLILTCGGGRSPAGNAGTLIAIRALDPETIDPIDGCEGQ